MKQQEQQEMEARKQAQNKIKKEHATTHIKQKLKTQHSKRTWKMWIKHGKTVLTKYIIKMKINWKHKKGIETNVKKNKKIKQHERNRNTQVNELRKTIKLQLKKSFKTQN